MNFLLLLASLVAAPAYADSIAFDCQNFAPPQQQGDERFVKLVIQEGKVSLEIADLTSPLFKVESLYRSEGANYSHTSSSAYAGFGNEKGNAVALSLVFFGKWWAGNLRFNQDVVAPGLSFKAGEEIDLRCNERVINLTKALGR